MARELLASGAPIVLAGDYNVMPTELDVYKPERWVNDALFRVEVRDAFSRLIAEGWTDALRTLHPGERIYTFWDYFRNAYARDAGLRIDHLLLSPSVAPRLKAAGVDRDVRGWEKASDHAPVWIELAEQGGAPEANAPAFRAGAVRNGRRLRRLELSLRRATPVSAGARERGDNPLRPLPSQNAALTPLDRRALGSLLRNNGGSAI